MFRKICLTTLVILFGMAAQAVVVEQEWFNNVTEITADEQYYIYSVNANRFMVPGEDTLLIPRFDTVAKPFTMSLYEEEEGEEKAQNSLPDSYYTYSGESYLCAKFNGICGPVGTKETDGNKLYWVWVKKSEAWNIHSQYNTVYSADNYGTLRFTNKYEVKTNSGYWNTQTDPEYLWWLITPAQYDLHWAIYAFDSYKDTTSIMGFSDKVETSVYIQLMVAYSKTFSVKDETLTAAAVDSTLQDLQERVAYAKQYPDLYERAIFVFDSIRTVAQSIPYTEIPNAMFDLLHKYEDVTFSLVYTPMATINDVITFLKNEVELARNVMSAYKDGLAAIQALEDYPDKGDGNLTQIEDDIAAAREAMEAATTLDAVLNAAKLKNIDPITFVGQIFALNSDLSNIASAESGLPVSYVSDNHDVVDENMKAVSVGGTTITASTQGNSDYYHFVREKQIFILENLPSGIDRNEDDAECTKILRDGQIYIRRGGELYNILGRKSN